MGKEGNIPLLRQLVRSTISSVFSLGAPHDVIHVVPGGLERACDLVDKGYGLIVAFTHSTFRDIVDLSVWLEHQRSFESRPMISPIAIHQIKPGINMLIELFDIEAYPIVTEDSRKRPEYAKLDRREVFDLYSRYVQAASRGLRNGGIVPIALQGGRRPTLGEPTNGLSTIMHQTSRDEIDNYAVLFVGVEYPGAENNPDASKHYNLFKRYRLNVGSVSTAGEIYDKVGKGHAIDNWAYEQLALLVRKSYLTEKA